MKKNNFVKIIGFSFGFMCSFSGNSYAEDSPVLQEGLKSIAEKVNSNLKVEGASSLNLGAVVNATKQGEIQISLQIDLEKALIAEGIKISRDSNLQLDGKYFALPGDFGALKSNITKIRFVLSINETATGNTKSNVDFTIDFNNSFIHDSTPAVLGGITRQITPPPTGPATTPIEGQNINPLINTGVIDQNNENQNTILRTVKKTPFGVEMVKLAKSNSDGSVSEIQPPIPYVMTIVPNLGGQFFPSKGDSYGIRLINDDPEFPVGVKIQIDGLNTANTLAENASEAPVSYMVNANSSRVIRGWFKDTSSIFYFLVTNAKDSIQGQRSLETSAAGFFQNVGQIHITFFAIKVNGKSPPDFNNSKLEQLGTARGLEVPDESTLIEVLPGQIYDEITIRYDPSP